VFRDMPHKPTTTAPRSEPTPDPNEADEEREVRLRAESDLAFRDGRFDEAFNRMQQAGLDEAIRWFREEGVTFTKRQPEITPLELIVGLAAASHAEVVERGEAAPDKLVAAATFLWALAELRQALARTLAPNVKATGLDLAELTMRAAVLGEMTGLVNAVRLGWMEKLTRFERDRERRRLGATTVNERKATAKEEAFAQALRIAGVNPTLSNEDLALKLGESVATTVKTRTEWVRRWRRQGFIPPQKKPQR
jgi:hypothetical protein